MTQKNKIFVTAWRISFADLSQDRIDRLVGLLSNMGVIVNLISSQIAYELIVVAPTNVLDTSKLHNLIMQVYDFDSFIGFELGLIGPYKQA